MTPMKTNSAPKGLARLGRIVIRLAPPLGDAIRLSEGLMAPPHQPPPRLPGEKPARADDSR